MTRQELINAVKTKIDELSPLDGVVTLAGLVHDKPVDTFADALLDECAREVLAKAPVSRLRPYPCLAPAFNTGNGVGFVPLPDDFVRLLEFKMSEWQRPVNTVCEPGSDLALRQHNKFTRGGCCKPVCVFGHCEGARVLEYYSVERSHEIERFLYVQDVPAEDIPVDLQDVLTWWCASRIWQIVGRQAEAQMAYERGKNLL